MPRPSFRTYIGRLYKRYFHSPNDIAYLLSSGLWLNINSGVVLVLSFLISIAYARFLPKEVYGTYQYLLSLFSILTAFTLTGMNSAITRSVARGNEGTLKASILPQLRWNLLAALVSLSFSAYYFIHSDHALSFGTLFIALLLPFTTTFNSYSAFLMGKKAFRTLFFYSTAVSLVYYLCIFFAIVYFPSALVLIFVNLFITAVGAIALHLLTLRKFKPSNQNDPDLLTYGKHLTVMNIFTTIVGQFDNILVFHFLGPVQLATYSFATLLPEKAGGFLKNITTSSLPRFAEQHFSKIRTNLFQNALLLGFIISLSVGLYILIAPLFFYLVYSRYLDAVSYSQLYAFTLFTALGNYLGTSLLAHRRLRRLYVLNVLYPVVQLLLMLAGIIVWGLWGLIAARVVAMVFFLFLTILLVLFQSRTSTSRNFDPAI